MKSNHEITIAEIYREHGVKGFCKVYSYSGDDLNLKPGQTYTLSNVDGRSQESVLESIQVLGRYYLVKFDGFTTPEAVSEWRKAKISIKESALAREKGVLYDHEWCGYVIIDQNDTRIGSVAKIQYTPLPNFLIELESTGDEALIPFVEDWILKHDTKKKTLKMDLPEGLI